LLQNIISDCLIPNRK